MNPGKTKVTAAYYTQHLRRQLIPECETLYPENDFIFQQDGATSHTSNQCQAFLKETLGRGRYISKIKNEWPPKSPDLNVLDYYFWSRVAVKVYEGRKEPFQTLEKLKGESDEFRVWSRI